jgi:hypothetical protein
VLIRGAVYFKQEEFVAAALMERARKHEHVPPLAAQAAKYAEDKYNSTQLVSSSRRGRPLLPVPPPTSPLLCQTSTYLQSSSFSSGDAADAASELSRQLWMYVVVPPGGVAAGRVLA